MAGPIDPRTSPTVADDAGWLGRVAAEINLPAYLTPGLGALYAA